MNDRPLLDASDITVSYRHEGRWLTAVRAAGFSLSANEVLGFAGESGSGKSTLVGQTLGYRHPNARIDSGRLLFRGRDVLGMDERDLRQLRGNRIALVPQNPTTSLSPGMRAGAQIAEVLTAHDFDGGRVALRDRLAELFRLTGLDGVEGMARRYPHQLSGGQQQRLMIAMALACRPDVVVLDEPTTGLDTTTQKQVLDLLRRLKTTTRMSMLYVTHDLAVLSEIADRVGIMYAGQVVEIAPADVLYSAPRHPYTIGLLGSRPLPGAPAGGRSEPLRGLLRRDQLPPGCPFQPRCAFSAPSCRDTPQALVEFAPGHAVACQRHELVAARTSAPRVAVAPKPTDREAAAPLLELDGVSLGYRGGGFLARPRPVVRDISLAIRAGETLALVGESGSGKSTVARGISGLLSPLAGRIRYSGTPLAPLLRQRALAACRDIQYVFQNPDASLNPRMRVGRILEQPLEVFFRDDAATRRRKITAALESVQLDSTYASRYPDQLSGGERQRVAIARAMIVEPALFLCDEVLSALDVSVQAHIVELLDQLKRSRRIAMLFISHDLAVVRVLADRVAVLFHGMLVEEGPAAEVFAPPYHPYTLSLFNAVPGSKAVTLRAPPATTPPPEVEIDGGCTFAARCPVRIGPLCNTKAPPPRRTLNGSTIHCHHELGALATIGGTAGQIMEQGRA